VAEQNEETFRPTDGRVAGVLTLIVVLGLMALGVVADYPLWGFGLLAAIGVLTWAAMLQPVVRIADDELVLRNMFITIGIPLAAVEEVAVGRVLAVRAGGRRYVSPAISRTLRQTLRSRRQGVGRDPDDLGRDLVALAASSYPDFVEERIRIAAADHRDRLDIKGWSDEQDALARQVRRDLSWPELAALGVALVVTLVGVVVEL
jgi:hypothetical protein